jgi:hypothetical protein
MAGFRFLGFMPRAPYAPDGKYDARSSLGVSAICSVSECLRDRGDVWTDHWEVNGGMCYATEAGARRRAPDATVYALELYEAWPAGVHAEPGPVERLPDGFEPLPVEDAPAWPIVGFDVVGLDAPGTTPYGCSPLSCNGYASEPDVHVNAACLFDELAQAVAFAARCQREQPEPGDYVVIRVRSLSGA